MTGSNRRPAGEFLLARYREVVETVLRFKDSREKLIRRAVIALLPRLAAFAPERFAQVRGGGAGQASAPCWCWGCALGPGPGGARLRGAEADGVAAPVRLSQLRATRSCLRTVR